MRLNICYIVGGNSWVPGYVSLYSVIINNQDIGISAYILSEENNDNVFFENIQPLYDSHQDIDIHFIQVNKSEFDDLPSPGRHLSYGVYHKLGLHRLCPVNGNVLLLDADTICDGSLKELLSVDLKNRILAAAPSSKPETVRLNLPLNRPKFNAGVLLINLDQWEERDVEQQAREYIKKEKPKLNDQDALNVLLNKENTTEYIHPRYNATKKWITEFSEADEEPTIIHYNGPDKPWRYVTEREGGDVWRQYATQTVFESHVPVDKGIKEILWVKFRSALRVLRS